MEPIKRYSVTIRTSKPTDPQAMLAFETEDYESEQGRFVLYADHEAAVARVEAERDALQAYVDWALQQVLKLRAALESLRDPGHDDRCWKSNLWTKADGVPYRCICGADEHNARIDEALR